MNSDLRVGLDIGGTKILGAVVDADGVVVAQSRQATRPGADDLAYLSLGTGLAAGFVLSGKLRRGARGAAGEIGTIIIGGGVASAGEPLLVAVTAALRAQAATSPFLAALDLASRIRLLPGQVPVGAIGAALIGNAG